MSKNPVPINILSYRLVKMLNPSTAHRSFVYALYRDPRGRKAFAKIWINSKKNFDYYSLINEKNWYEAFSHMGNKALKQQGVSVPNYLGWKEGPNFAALLIQLIKGYTAEKISPVKQYAKILQVRRFLQSVTPSALNLKGPGNHINIRHHHLAILAFPLFLFKTRKYPFVLKNFTKICLKYLKSLKLLFISFPTVIAHKSIEPKNIIIADRKTYLIDFQLAVFSNPIIDVVETLFFCWSNKKLRQLAIEHDAESTMRSKTYKDLFQFLTLYTGIHQLSEGVIEPHVIEEYLSFCLSL